MVLCESYPGWIPVPLFFGWAPYSPQPWTGSSRYRRWMNACIQEWKLLQLTGKSAQSTPTLPSKRRGKKHQQGHRKETLRIETLLLNKLKDKTGDSWQYWSAIISTDQRWPWGNCQIIVTFNRIEIYVMIFFPFLSTGNSDLLNTVTIVWPCILFSNKQIKQ